MKLQALDSVTARENLIAGKGIFDCDLQEIDISGLILPGLQIHNSRVGSLVADGAVFEGPVELAGTRVGLPPEAGRVPGPDSDIGSESILTSFRNAVFQDSASVIGSEFLGMADFTGCKFNGGAEFCETVFAEEAVFLNAYFAGRILFDGVKFAGRVDFSDSDFDEEASFRRARFEGETDFAEAEFVSAEFQDAWFGGNADLHATLFGGWADFSRTEFRSSLDFSRARFNRGADFCEAKFRASISFEASNFVQDCNFAEAEFHGLVDFDQVECQQHADFRDCSFAGPFTSRGATLGRIFLGRSVFGAAVDMSECTARELSLRGSTLECGLTLRRAEIETVSLEEARLGGPADFLETRFQGTAVFDQAHFADAWFKGVQFSGFVSFLSATFSGKGDFSQAEFLGTTCFLNASSEDLLLTWEQVRGSLRSERERDFEKARREYGLLKNLFERHNEYDDMDSAHRMFKRCERKAKQFSRKRPYRYLSKPLNALFLDLGSGYGTRPMNVGVFTLLTIAFFAMVYSMFSNQILLGGETAAGFQDLGFHLYYSFVVFISIGAENVHPDYHDWLKYVVAAEGFSGFFLMTLFVVTFTRKVIR